MEGYIFKKFFLPLKIFGMYFRFFAQETIYHVRTEMRQRLVHADLCCDTQKHAYRWMIYIRLKIEKYIWTTAWQNQ